MHFIAEISIIFLQMTQGEKLGIFLNEHSIYYPFAESSGQREADHLQNKVQSPQSEQSNNDGREVCRHCGHRWRRRGTTFACHSSSLVWRFNITQSFQHIHLCYTVGFQAPVC